MRSRPKYYLTVLNYLVQVLLATNSAVLRRSSEEGGEQEKRVEVSRDEEGKAVRREVAVTELRRTLRRWGTVLLDDDCSSCTERSGRGVAWARSGSSSYSVGQQK